MLPFKRTRSSYEIERTTFPTVIFPTQSHWLMLRNDTQWGSELLSSSTIHRTLLFNYQLSSTDKTECVFIPTPIYFFMTVKIKRRTCSIKDETWQSIWIIATLDIIAKIWNSKIDYLADSWCEIHLNRGVFHGKYRLDLFLALPIRKVDFNFLWHVIVGVSFW